MAAPLAAAALLGGCFLASLLPKPPLPANESPQTVIRDVMVIDGMGGEPRHADVLVAGDRIAAVGEFRPAQNDVVVDGHGLVLAPGFIALRRGAGRELLANPDALADVSRGITTVVSLGGGDEAAEPVAALADSLTRAPAAVNVAMYADWSRLRQQVVGTDSLRPATAEEIAGMQAALRQALETGALGLAVRMGDVPAGDSASAELTAVISSAAGRGMHLMAEIGGEGEESWQAIHRAIAIGRQAGVPVQLTLSAAAADARADSLIRLLDAARGSGAELSAALSLPTVSTGSAGLRKLLAWPHTSLFTGYAPAGSDAAAPASFARILGHYVRERKIVALSTAVRQAAALAAENAGLTGRGLIAPGSPADLVLLDPGRVSERATPADPQALAAGIARVWVNGVTVYQSGAATGAHPGQLIRP